MGGLFLLFDVTVVISYVLTWEEFKNFLGNVQSQAPRQFPGVKGSFTPVKVSHVTAPIIRRLTNGMFNIFIQILGWTRNCAA